MPPRVFEINDGRQRIPEHWAWKALMQAMLHDIPDNTDEKAKVKQHVDSLTSADSMKHMEKACRLSQAYGENRSKLELAVARVGLPLEAGATRLRHHGRREVKEGRAPRGP